MYISKEVAQKIFETGHEIITGVKNAQELLDFLKSAPKELTDKGNIKIPLAGISYLKKIKDLEEDTIFQVKEGSSTFDLLGNLSGTTNILTVSMENRGSPVKEIELICSGEHILGICIESYNMLTSPYTSLEAGMYTKKEIITLFPAEKFAVVR